MRSIFEFILLMLFISFNKLSCEASLRETYVKKGLGTSEKYIEDYSKCAEKKGNFVYYDIDLYQNEFLDISCEVGSYLKPVNEGKYFKSADFHKGLKEPVEKINMKNTELLSNAPVELKFYDKPDFSRIHYTAPKELKKVQPIYFHCMNYLQMATATIQVNLMPDFELIEKSVDFQFDEFKFSSDGKKLTYIKSIRPGVLTKTTCKDSKLTVKYSGLVSFSEGTYSALKKLFNTDLEYKDVSKDFVKEAEGVHKIDLSGADTIIKDAEKCKTVLTCTNESDRELIYVYTDYSALKGINSGNKEVAKPLPFDETKKTGFIVDSSETKTVFMNIPSESTLTPKECPLLMESHSDKKSKPISNMKVTKLTSQMYLLDLSSVSSDRTDHLSCRASKNDEKKESNMVVSITPSCNLSATGPGSAKMCTIFTDLKSSFSVSADTIDAGKLEFGDSFYSRNEDEYGHCERCTYTKLTGKMKPTIKKGTNSVSVTFQGDSIEQSPVYFLSTSSKTETEKNPNYVVEIHLTDSKAFVTGDTVDTADKVKDKSKFYSVSVSGDSVTLDCFKFFEEATKLLKPYVFPEGKNMLFSGVKDGESDPKLLKGVPIDNLYRTYGSVLNKDKNSPSMKIDLTHFYNSTKARPMYFICANDTGATSWSSGKKPYAVIAMTVAEKDLGEKSCGITGSDISKQTDEKEKCEYKLKDDKDSYAFYCPYKETGTEPGRHSWTEEGKGRRTYVSCTYGDDNKLVEDKDFYDLMYETKESATNSNIILFTKKTPIFKKGLAKKITCECKINHYSTVEITSGFLTKGLALILLSAVLATAYSL